MRWLGVESDALRDLYEGQAVRRPKAGLQVWVSAPLFPRGNGVIERPTCPFPRGNACFGAKFAGSRAETQVQVLKLVSFRAETRRLR
jgi:hypothetical protein